ncbi:unnamed protein product, partial [Polarella glacialis]
DTMAAFGRDVFIHRFQIAESGVWVGQEVTFEVELNKTGHPQARCVQSLSAQEGGMGAGGGMGGGWDQYGGGGWGGGFSQMGYGGNSDGYGGFGGMQPGRDSRFLLGGVDTRTALGMMGGDSSGDVPGTSEPIEEIIRKCSGSAGMWEIIEQYGQFFSKKHVVTALYQLGLCRQYERRSGSVASETRSLTRALVDRLVHVPPRELAADEASRVLWALAALEEAKDHSGAHRFALDLGQEASKRYHEFSPSQMATFVNSLSRLVRAPDEDELVGKITMSFSEYALGNGAFPRFPPEELKSWTSFLQEASGSSQTGPQPPPGGFPYGMPPGGMRPQGTPGGGGFFG